jgi:hypothetical protein
MEESIGTKLGARNRGGGGRRSFFEMAEKCCFLRGRQASVASTGLQILVPVSADVNVLIA